MKKTGIFAVLLFVIFTSGVFAAKTVFIPTEFASLGLDWDMTRSYQTDNFICFWGTLAGADPTICADTTLRFDPALVCNTLETIYAKYITDIQFCADDASKKLGQYKCIIMMNNTFSSPNGPTGWAFGGAYDNTIGAMWVNPAAMADGYATAHEFTHSLQQMISIDKNNPNTGGGFVNYDPAGFFWETHANYMRSQLYTESCFNWDMPRWIGTSMFHWSSTRHHYDSFRPLYVLQEQYGIVMINRLWKESLRNEHPLVTLKRLMGWSQSQLNDFFFGYAGREVTDDYPVLGVGALMQAEMTRIKNQEPHYLWRLYALLDRVDGFSDRYIVPDEFAPQDYGYNMIPLYPANTSQPVCVKFAGHTEANTYAGWRYGIVSVTTGGTPRYGAMYSDNTKEFAFQPMADESSWYLVVMGAPVTHTSYVWEPGWPKIKRYPYEIRLSNASPEGWQANYRSDIRAKFAGHVSANGGGWVANSATVAASVYVGPRVVVLGNSNISGAVSISGTAWVQNAAVSGNVIIDRNARVYGGNISQNAHITDNALIYNSTVSGSVIAKDDTFDWGSTFSGASTVGGDAEITSATTDGVYLQCPHANNGRAVNDGKGATDTSNIDVNAAAIPYADTLMQFTGGCVVMSPTVTNTNTIIQSPSFTLTVTWTITPSFTRTPTVTFTRTFTRTVNPTITAGITADPSPTSTTTGTISATQTRTGSPSSTASFTETPAATGSPTGSITATVVVTAAGTFTSTATQTEIQTPTTTGTAVINPTFTATNTKTPSLTQTATNTKTASPTRTTTPSPTFTTTNTKVPSRTITITDTALPSPALTATNIPPATPTPTATIFRGDKFEITGVLIYPNPYIYLAGDLNMKIDITRPAEDIKARIYSVSFRRLLEHDFNATDNKETVAVIPKAELSRLASGTYYVVITGRSTTGDKAVSKPQVLIILK